MQAKGADWAQLISQAQQQQQASAGGSEALSVTTLLLCFADSAHSPKLLSFTDSVVAALREGSSISAGLTAAGYDMGPVLQGSEAITACYPGVLS
jgi:hypothetical protein